jgi:iron-sulfur cluster repair protein YtfE (RIC family)
MTFDTNEILKRLENGENVNDIAAAAANAINDALKLQEKKKKEAEAKKKMAAAETKRAKIEDLGFLIEEVIDFFHEYYPELLDGKEEIADDKVREIAGELVDVFDKAYNETMDFMNSDMFKKIAKKDDKDAIKDFLKENGLI